MALIAVGGMRAVAIGGTHRQFAYALSLLSPTTIDAANEAIIMVGRIRTTDGASHTINTTGSSSLQWRSAGVTFANAGTTLVVGLATVDTTTGPPVRATNVADVITPSVSKSHTGGGGTVTSSAWQINVPNSGAMTIANGDLVAFFVQMTARAGVDSVVVSTETGSIPTARPSVTSFTGGAYSNTNLLPNCIITFSDGVRGYFQGGYVASLGLNSNTWNNTSGTKEYGNIVQFPFPVKAVGIVAGAIFSGDTDLILYSDPLGTPVAQKTVSIDSNAIGLGGTAFVEELFPASFDLAASTPYAVIFKATSATDISAVFKTYNDAADQDSDHLGTNCYAVNRASGAFAAQNSSKDRFAIGLLVDAFDAGGIAGRFTQINNSSLVA